MEVLVLGVLYLVLRTRSRNIHGISQSAAKILNRMLAAHPVGIDRLHASYSPGPTSAAMHPTKIILGVVRFVVTNQTTV